MKQSFVRPAVLALMFVAMALGTAALPLPAQAQAPTIPASCTYAPIQGGFTQTCFWSLNCTLAATPSTNVAPKNPITLTTTCVPAASGSATYAWSMLFGDPTNCPPAPTISTAATSLTATNPTAPACVYQVVVADGAKGGTATQTVSWTSGPPPAPIGCTESGTTTPPTLTSAGGGLQLNANCTSPTSGITYSWTRNGGAWSTLQNPTDTLAANSGSGAVPYTYQATACNGASCTVITPIVPESVPGSGGGGGGGGISCPGFNNTYVLVENWASPTRMYGNFGTNDIVVVQFTTGSLTAPGKGGGIEGIEFGSSPTVRVASLSATPCDFSTALETQSSQTVILQYMVGGTSLPGIPALQPSTTYYANIKNAPNPACAKTGVCNMAIDFTKPRGL